MWRRWLFGLCAFGFLQLGVCVWMQELHFGSLPGFEVAFFGAAPGADAVLSTPTTTPYVYELTIPAGNPLARTGVRNGDLIDLRAASAADRYRWATNFWWAGEQFHATILRGGRIRHFTLTAEWLPLDWYGRVANAGILWMLLFATMLAWLRSGDREARTLALLLLITNIGINFQAQNWITPWPALDAILECLSWPISAGGIVLLATYAMLFARPPGVLRRILAWASYGAAVACGIVGLLWTIAVAFEVPLGIEGLSRAQLSDVASNATYCLPLLCLLATIPRTHGAERARITWASIPLVPLYLIYALPESLFVGPVAHWMLYVDNVMLFLVPLGLTYALLSRRLLDVGFALNRAAVFAVTSLLLAGLFAGLQWLANAFLTGMVRVHNIAVEMTIVVVVYYAIRLSRRQTDAIVSRLFFAARNRRLQALRELPQIVDEISDAEAIAPITVRYLANRAEIDAHVVWQDADAESLPAADPEWRERSVAFPMLIRGQLRGTLFCRPADDGGFAPDEMLALETLAYRMATDRDDILAASLRAELAAMRLQAAGLRESPAAP